jgi:hypothetical protein
MTNFKLQARGGMGQMGRPVLNLKPGDLKLRTPRPHLPSTKNPAWQMHTQGSNFYPNRERLGGDDDLVDVHAAALLVKAHLAVHEGEDGEVFAETDVCAGLPLGAALAADDVAGDDNFTTELFDAETLALAIASVFNATLTFFMSHDGSFL